MISQNSLRRASAAIALLLTAPGCRSEPEVVDTTIAERSAATQPAVAPISVSTEEVAEAAAPEITAAWLVGTWGPAAMNPSNNPHGSCETDVLITFNGDGTFEDGASRGRYSTDGHVVRYIDRQSVPDIAAEPNEPFTPEPMEDIVAKVSALDANTFDEEGEKWRRCTKL